MPDETRTAQLARRYRRWLLAYPRRYRRARGPEILATLLDAAAAGQTRPARREAFQLLRHGLGQRAAEVGRRGVVIAVIAAVLGGLSGIALGSWLSWRHVDPMAPGATTASRLARTVLPNPLDGPYYDGRHTFWNPYSEGSLHGGTGVRAGRAGFNGTVSRHADYRRIAATAQRRMHAHGWHDVRTTINHYGSSTEAVVTGKHHGYLTSVQVERTDGVNPGSVRLAVMWAEPPGQFADTVAGGLAGALLGALLGLGTSARMRRRGRDLQRAYSRLCLATLLLLAPACLGNIPTWAGSAMTSTDRNGPGPSIYWGGFVIFGAEPLAILSLVPILAILASCVWPHRALTRIPTTR